MKPQTNKLYFLALFSFLLFALFIYSSTVKPYGFFIDELYFIACSKRLAWGYIDQPPLSIALLALARWIFGNSMMAIRLLPALSVSATVYVSGLITSQLGGSLKSILLTALAVAVMPVLLLFGSFYSMNAYEPLIFSLIGLFVIRMIKGNNPVYWLHIGILMSIGLEMKHTIVLYGIALLIGFLMTEKRKLLWNRWFISGGVACFLLILPNLIWQVVNHFPTLELYHNSFVYKNIGRSPLQVISEQIIFMNPATFPLWITGLIAPFFGKLKDFRLMFFSYAFLLGVLIVGQSSRPDRIAAIYPFLVAMGTVAIERYLKSGKQQIVQLSLASIMIAGGILLAPLFCPLLPPAQLKPYISKLGIHFDIEAGKKGEPIPQWLADRIGWRELAAEVGQVYHSLPPEEQQNTVIVSSNYGEAGALEYYGHEYDLPVVYGTHNSFHSWGPPSDTVRTFIGVYIDAEEVKSMFESVEEVSVYHCLDCTKPQQQIPIYILRGPKFSMKKEWPGFKIYG
jgi:hypothetical protein